MDKKLYWYWGVTEIATGAFLLNGISGWAQITAFLVSHGLAILLTYMIFGVLIGSDSQLRKNIITKGFLAFMCIVASVPLMGPAAVLFLIIFLRFFPIYPVRTESFKKISKEMLVVMQKKIEGRSIPVTEALLIRGLSREESLRMVAVISEMDWTAAKTGILKYIIRLSPYQNVVLMAIDMLRKKMDAILAEIARLNSTENPSGETKRRLANLYHEICYLDLCDPIMRQSYRDKACQYALLAYTAGKEKEDDAIRAVKYLIGADRVAEAKEIYEKIRSREEYFVPKWITYEFELSVRLEDQTWFDNLYLLIETGGGTFIPDKVKKAAIAWKKVLTSAWL